MPTVQYARYTRPPVAVRRKPVISLRTRYLDGPTVRPGGPYDLEVGAHLIEKIPEVVAHRGLRSITTEHLKPLHKLQGWNFIDAWFQCAEAHYLAWTHGIHHQDPSLDNLMYRGRRDSPLRRDGRSKACPLLDICPVLNDWDLAVDASAPQTHTGLQRTGTMQFMAFARLNSGAWDGYRLQHLYRHDLEAFFYILAWVLCCYKDGQRLDPLPPLFETWTKGDTNECYNSKYRFIHDEGDWPYDSYPTDSWSSAMVAFADIIRLFFTVMLYKLAGSPESWMQSRLDGFMAQIEGRAPPPPKEDDKPTEIWEDFCGAVKEGLLILSDRMNLKKEDLPPRLASFLPDSQMDTPL
ncbi:hypothetical protein GGG16DRAFT_50821 [Schizophyllum commune]